MRWTLWLYIARRFLYTVGATFLAVLMLVVIVDMVELLRSNKELNLKNFPVRSRMIF